MIGPGVLSRWVGRGAPADRLRLVPAERTHREAGRAIVAASPAVHVHVGAHLSAPPDPEQETWALLDGARLAGIVIRWRGTAWALEEGYADDPRVPTALARLVAQAAWPQEALFGPEAMVERIGKSCEPHGAQLVEIRRQQMMLCREAIAPPVRALDLPFRIRRARPDELAWLLATHAAMCREDLGVDQVARNAAGYERYFAELVKDGRAIVGELGGERVAKAEVPLVSGQCWLIEGVYTAPAQRGLGLATRLMLELDALARRDGRLPCLYVHRRNRRAAGIYERCGYEVVSDWATAVVGRERRGGGKPAEW
jgi:predicted GNAT family acetyltransferase